MAWPPQKLLFVCLVVLSCVSIMRYTPFPGHHMWCHGQHSNMTSFADIGFDLPCAAVTFCQIIGDALSVLILSALLLRDSTRWYSAVLVLLLQLAMLGLELIRLFTYHYRQQAMQSVVMDNTNEHQLHEDDEHRTELETSQAQSDVVVVLSWMCTSVPVFWVILSILVTLRSQSISYERQSTQITEYMSAAENLHQAALKTAQRKKQAQNWFQNGNVSVRQPERTVLCTETERTRILLLTNCVNEEQSPCYNRDKTVVKQLLRDPNVRQLDTKGPDPEPALLFDFDAAKS